SPAACATSLAAPPAPRRPRDPPRPASLARTRGRGLACAPGLTLAEAAAIAQQRNDVRGRLLRRAGVERRLRVVLDAELDRLRDGLAGDPRGECERHVDAGGDAGGGRDLAIEDDALGD